MGTERGTEVVSTGLAYMVAVISCIGAVALPTLWLWVLVRAFKMEGTGFLNALLTTVCCWIALFPIFYDATDLPSFLKDPTLITQKGWLIRSLISLAAFTALIAFLLHTDYLRRAFIFALIHTVALYFWTGVLYRLMDAHGSFKVFEGV